jgi:hypothetical protein
MSDDADAGEIDAVVETELIDVDGDGVIDAVTKTTTVVADIDGDGVVDVVERTTTTAYDVDGDGIADAIESTTVTGVDDDGDGSFSDDEISVETVVAVREDLIEDGETPE